MKFRSITNVVYFKYGLDYLSTIHLLKMFDEQEREQNLRVSQRSCLETFST